MFEDSSYGLLKSVPKRQAKVCKYQEVGVDIEYFHESLLQERRRCESLSSLISSREQQQPQYRHISKQKWKQMTMRRGRNAMDSKSVEAVAMAIPKRSK